MQTPQSKETLKLEIIHAVTRMDDLQLLTTLYQIIQLGKGHDTARVQIKPTSGDKNMIGPDPDAIKQLQEAIDDLFFVD